MVLGPPQPFILIYNEPSTTTKSKFRVTEFLHFSNGTELSFSWKMIFLICSAFSDLGYVSQCVTKHGNNYTGKIESPMAKQWLFSNEIFLRLTLKIRKIFFNNFKFHKPSDSMCTKQRGTT